MQLYLAVNNVLVQLSATIQQLTEQEYVQPSKTLFGNTIGQHVRHIIELYQCLEKGYEEGTVSYDKRKRDTRIETDKAFAEKLMHDIYKAIHKPDKSMILEACYDDSTSESLRLVTNYYREIAYNLEHTIHHMALIRAGVNEVSKVEVPENFGVAISTVKFRNQCAQ